MDLIQRIDCGFCIENTSPYSKTYCECYKVPIPYNLCGNKGVLYLCKGWVNYLMLHLRDGDNQKIIAKELSKCLIEKYPIFDSDEVAIGSHWSSNLMGGKLGDLSFIATPMPYQITLSMTPMFFINNIMVEGAGLWKWEDSYLSDETPAMNNWMKRKMTEIGHYNINTIKHYIDHNTGRYAKYETLLNQLLTKIKNL
jgi:hypothetical protein